jgi:dTDP-4-dehydrorhamnose reductase
VRTTVFADEAELEDRLSTPTAGLVADLGAIDGDLLVLGAGGKMGPSLCRLARRALDQLGQAGGSGRRVIAVSRWTDKAVEQQLKDAGVETVTYDLTADDELAGLPDAANVVFMAGAKFGSTGRPASTWATNVLIPSMVARRFADSRIAAFSTGNVYPLVSVSEGGSVEDDAPDPVGEYAMSCLGRERVFEYAAEHRGTRVALIRLNYAIDLRYGVLADIGRKVHDGLPVDVTTGHVNVVWQGYANEVTLRALRLATAPAFVLNVTGPETASVREIARIYGRLYETTPQITGTEAPTALLSNAGRCHGLFGYPELSLRQLIEAQADWIRKGGVLWDKPTKFERRDGRF